MNKFKLFGEFEPKTMEQIESIRRSKAFENETIAIMPDAHYGKGAPVGFTATFTDKIIPNLVGVDIGCGMTMVKLPSWFIKSQDKLKMLQTYIRKNIPYGRGVNENNKNSSDAYFVLNILKDLTFELDDKSKRRIFKSLGSLGGGNHFIEVNENKNGELFLVIHSGSRSLGVKVATHHQNIAKSNFVETKPTKEQMNAVEPKLREEFIKNFSTKKIQDTPEKDLEYLVGSQVDDYLNDMELTQEYAKRNREHMIVSIVSGIIDDAINAGNEAVNISDFKRTMETITHTIHNYIDIEKRIIRKGAIFADEENDIIIPLNMRDGSIIARGKGNKESNFSAPHGAGRLMSRTVAKNEIDLEEFKETMKDVTSWTINKNTLDEAPMAYKSKEFILKNIGELVEVKEVIKPIFNFKDDSEGINYRKKRRK